jgi:hypothetical protein
MPILIINKILISINSTALLVLGYCCYKNPEPESFSACIIGTATLIGLIWKESEDKPSDIWQPTQIIMVTALTLQR